MIYVYAYYSSVIAVWFLIAAHGLHQVSEYRHALTDREAEQWMLESLVKGLGIAIVWPIFLFAWVAAFICLRFGR